MLSRLSIKDVVLIEKLNLDFEKGLCVFTGETGAGKSILLDSLALATGARADSSLVRHGANKLSVTAEISLPKSHKVFDMLAEQGLSVDPDEGLFLRRVVTVDGKSKAYINDETVSAGFLRSIGDELIEIHGQFATHGLLNVATHQNVLDSYGGLLDLKTAVKKAYKDWQSKIKQKQAVELALAEAVKEEEFLRHCVAEFEQFNPTKGEEEELSEKRSLMMNVEKIAEGLKATHAHLTNNMLDKSLRQAQRQLEGLCRLTPERFDSISEMLEKVVAELCEVTNEVESQCHSLELDAGLQENVEERLFALKGLARKHQVDTDSLPDLWAEFDAKLNSLEKGGEELSTLTKEVEALRLAYLEKAQILSNARAQKALQLDTAVKAELAPLKLEKAIFKTQIERLPESLWHEDGFDKTTFMASTNAGQPLSVLSKIASGGELARFMLALKVNLATAENIPTLIFDEVDSAVGGATASAVGERLARLANENCQVLAITHSPQVASFGSHHFRVEKSEVETGKVLTAVVKLDNQHRREEIARMLAGDTVTDASRHAADELLKNQGKIL